MYNLLKASTILLLTVACSQSNETPTLTSFSKNTSLDIYLKPEVLNKNSKIEGKDPFVLRKQSFFNEELKDQEVQNCISKVCGKTVNSFSELTPNELIQKKELKSQLIKLSLQPDLSHIETYNKHFVIKKNEEYEQELNKISETFNKFYTFGPYSTLMQTILSVVKLHFYKKRNSLGERYKSEDYPNYLLSLDTNDLIQYFDLEGSDEETNFNLLDFLNSLNQTKFWRYTALIQNFKDADIDYLNDFINKHSLISNIEQNIKIIKDHYHFELDKFVKKEINLDLLEEYHPIEIYEYATTLMTYVEVINLKTETKTKSLKEYFDLYSQSIKKVEDFKKDNHQPLSETCSRSFDYIFQVLPTNEEIITFTKYADLMRSYISNTYFSTNKTKEFQGIFEKKTKLKVLSSRELFIQNKKNILSQYKKNEEFNNNLDDLGLLSYILYKAVNLQMSGTQLTTELIYNQTLQICGSHQNDRANSDYFSFYKEHIGVSSSTIKYPIQGIGILAHEMGHAISRVMALIFNNNHNIDLISIIESEKKSEQLFSSQVLQRYSQHRACIASYTPSTSEFKHQHLEEDHADRFSTEIIKNMDITINNYACTFFNERNAQYFYETVNLEDRRHSANLFRLMHLQSALDLEIPKVCESVLSKNFENNLNCSSQ